jgi:outer membrane protein OmpA-like peptidoglycan-associated protein/uncharacterized protein YidB (DUF937 family)
MGVLDAVLIDTGSHLGISSGSASSVLSSLLSLISQDTGGVSGFLDRFRRAGFGNLVTSWLGGDPKALSVEAVESALGPQAIEQIGSRAGLSFSTAASAIAMMLPRVVPRLGAAGTAAGQLSAELMPYVTGSPAYASRVVPAEAGRPAGRYVWPALALLVLGTALALWLSMRTGSRVGAFNIEEQVRLASERAASAIAALRPGFSGHELVSALNLNAINFPVGAAEIPAASYGFLNAAAAALKAAPADTRVEVGGHTDNVGDPAANMQLSERRARAIRDYLVQQGVNAALLTAQGYGDTRPVASNATDEGRFHNRRIEFSIR